MNSTRRTWRLVALALVIGLILGGWAARAAVYLPLAFGRPVAAEPVAGVRVVDMHAWPEGACAILENDTPYTIRVSGFTVYLLDGVGSPVGSVSLDPLMYVLAPGQRTIARASYFSGSLPSYSSLIATVEWEPVAELEVLTAKLAPTWFGWQVTARIRNPLDVTVREPAIGAAIYDTTGHLVGATRGYWDTPTELAPGAEVTGEVVFFSSELDPAATPVTCTVYAVP